MIALRQKTMIAVYDLVIGAVIAGVLVLLAR